MPSVCNSINGIQTGLVEELADNVKGAHFDVFLGHFNLRALCNRRIVIQNTHLLFCFIEGDFLVLAAPDLKMVEDLVNERGHD